MRLAALSAVGAAALLATVLFVNTVSFSRRSELVETSPQMQQELMGCAKLAKEFKGAKVGARKVTQAQKIEAMRCMQVIKMAHAEKAHAIATRTSGLAEESCNCCAFAGCPCCQPAMQSGMQQLNYAMPSKAQSPYGQLPPQSFPFPHSAVPGGMPSSEEYGFKARVSQLKMKKPFFHREGKFARKTHKLQKMAAGSKNTMTQPKTTMISREKIPLGFTF